jgi:hypothetical protein
MIRILESLISLDISLEAYYNGPLSTSSERLARLKTFETSSSNETI